METSSLKNLISEIRTKSKHGSSMDELSKEYMDFRLKYIHMFDMILEGNDQQITYLINMIDAKDKYRSKYTPEQADKIMGYTLAQEFVYPNIKIDQVTQDKIDAELKDIEEMKRRVENQEIEFNNEQAHIEEQKRLQEDLEDMKADYNEKFSDI